MYEVLGRGSWNVGGLEGIWNSCIGVELEKRGEVMI